MNQVILIGKAKTFAASMNDKNKVDQLMLSLEIKTGHDKYELINCLFHNRQAELLKEHFDVDLLLSIQGELKFVTDAHPVFWIQSETNAYINCSKFEFLASKSKKF